MTVHTRTKLALGLGAVAIAAAVLPGAIASGQSQPTITGGGVLRLHLDDDDDFFRYVPPTVPGGATVTQKITAKSCVVPLTPSPSLVTLRPTPAAGAVGLVDDGLGVKTKGEGIGTPCGRVDGTGQALTLALVRSAGGVLQNKLIDFAELDIEAKFDVTVRARALLGGRQVWTDTLETGVGSDSGPDSGDGDNYRWRIDPPSFDQLVLTVDATTPNGSFSLEGGEDGTAPVPAEEDGLGTSLGTSDSVFQLVDVTGVIDCNETAPPVGGGDSPDATFSRGQNDNCEPIPYLLRSDDDSVLLQKDASGQDGANFLLDITWEPEAKPEVGMPLRLTTIDYDGPGGDEPRPVLWCDGTPEAPQLPAEATPEDTWCLASQSVALAGNRKIQVSESYYGAGDPRWAR